MLVHNISIYAKEIAKFKVFKSMLEPLKNVGKIESMVAYGLGSMNDNLTSQYQFACALALRHELGINSSIEIFDPAMGKEDAAIASELGCEVVPHNEEAKRVVLRKTLFYMPHCGFNLYNGLMWANWGKNMNNLFVIGNSFKGYSASLNMEQNLSNTNAIYPLIPYIKEFPLEIDVCSDGKTPIPDVYNSFSHMSVHYFDKDGFDHATKEGVWVNRPKEVIMGELIETGVNEEIDKYIEELHYNEEHEKKLKVIHDNLIKESDELSQSEDEDAEEVQEAEEAEEVQEVQEVQEEEDEDEDEDDEERYYCAIDATESESESEPESDDDDYDDMFEHMYSGWGAQVGNMLRPDRFTPEWSVDNSTINAYALGEKDPRQRIYVYNDEGVSAASKQMCVHTFRSFSNPNNYIVDTINADEFKNKDWEDNAALLIFPGGADRYYRKKLSAAIGNGSNKRIRAFIENGGKYMGICAGSYYGTSKVEFDVNGPLEVNEERELKLFRGRAIGPALKGFNYKTAQGQYAVPFVFNEVTPEGEVQRKGLSYYKGGPYFVPDPSSVVGKDYRPICFYAKHPRLSCPPGSMAGVSSTIRKGKAVLLGCHVEFDPWLMKPSDAADDIALQLRDPVLNQGRCRLIHNILKELEIDMLPMKFMEPENENYY